jgi:hypothetical protein
MRETKEVTALERLWRDEDKFGAAAVRRRPTKFNAGGVVALLALPLRQSAKNIPPEVKRVHLRAPTILPAPSDNSTGSSS